MQNNWPPYNTAGPQANQGQPDFMNYMGSQLNVNQMSKVRHANRNFVLGNGTSMEDVQNTALKGMGFNAPPAMGSGAPNHIQAKSDKMFGPNPFGKMEGGPALGEEMGFDTGGAKGGVPGQDFGEAPKPSPLGMLPAVGNAISLFNGLANGPEKTQLDRVDFQNVDYNPIIAANNASIQRGTNTTNTNIRQNARTFGQLSGGQSSANLRGAQAQGENTARLGAMERNTNAQINNQESQMNTGIANQEQEINDQNKAVHMNTMINDVIGIGTSVAGFGADKAMMAADFTNNNNFLQSMQYMSPIFRHMFDGKNFTPQTKFQKTN
jgi:hypothetical protein